MSRTHCSGGCGRGGSRRSSPPHPAPPSRRHTHRGCAAARQGGALSRCRGGRLGTCSGTTRSPRSPLAWLRRRTTRERTGRSKTRPTAESRMGRGGGRASRTTRLSGSCRGCARPCRRAARGEVTFAQCAL
eukprot:6182860-Pleurochrysis_carterae.AAC.4